jgi:hypothetical protein
VTEADPTPQRSRGRQAFQWLSLVAAIAVSVVALLWLTGPKPETPDLPQSPVEGVVVAVESAGLGQVSGFTLRGSGGRSYVLKLGSLENAAEFSPSHVTEHMASSEPVRAYYRLEGGQPVVYRLEDASLGSPAVT